MAKLSENLNPPLSFGEKTGIFFKSVLKGYAVTLIVGVILLLVAGVVLYLINLMQG